MSGPIDPNLLAEIERRLSQKKIYGLQPYDWQQDFFSGGAHYLQRMLMAANRVGKTFCAAMEVTYHATGEYPEDWKGFRIYKKNPYIWVSSLTNETSRDIIQKELLGDVGQIGTGLIPKERILDVKYRQAGIPDVVDTIIVSNINGGTTTIKTKVAEQGWKKYQGQQPDFIWQDEEPDDFKIVTECFARLMTSRGRYIITFTPLVGETEIVLHFHKNTAKRKVYTATWDEAPHLSEQDKEDYLETFPEHERATRTTGVPMMGEGSIFPIADKEIVCEPFEIPSHFFRICGVDYGHDHPAAGAWLAIDADTQKIYLYDEYKKERELAPYHASVIKSRDPLNYIPVVGPHDGLNSEKSSGAKIGESYAIEGVNMHPLTARYDDEKGGSQPVEPIAQEMLTLMRKGQFKVFNTCTGFLAEKRSLHRKKNKIVARNDDIFKACSYAMMMRRYAMPMNFATMADSEPSQPIF